MSQLTVYREMVERRGVRINHLFRECKVLRSRAFETVRLPGGDDLLVVCNACRTFTGEKTG